MNQTLFKFENNKINVLGSEEKPLFYASQVASILGYSNTKKAVYNHIWDINKTNVFEYNQQFLGTQNSPLHNLNHQTILINEMGLYQLIFNSKLEKAKQFQQWVLSVILPSIRKTGSFQPKLQHDQYVMLNERDLHEKVVDYIRTYYQDVLFNSTLGELQDSSDKRLMSYKMGYTSGFSDLIIYEHSKDFNGLCLEFKSPKGSGVLSEKQQSIQLKLKERGYKTITSSNYDDIIIELNDYLKNRRYKCYYCRLKYRSLDTLSTHLRVIHRK